MITFTSRIVHDDTDNLDHLTDSDRYLGISEPDKTTYEHQDHERIDAYIDGDWHMTGVIVSAIWQQPGYVPHEIAQESLWGIESDSGDTYYAEVIADLTAELKVQFPKLVKAIQELTMD